MIFRELYKIWFVFKKFLAFPLTLLQPLLLSIHKSYSVIGLVREEGGVVSAGMIWDLLRGVLFLLFIVGLALLICADTFRRVISAQRQGKGAATFFISLGFAAMILFVYYFIICAVLHVFVNYLLPVWREL